MKLVFPHGEHKPVELHGDSYRIGSAESADICLPTTGVAEEHAVIRKEGGDYVLVVDNPAHLASVNGKLVHEKKPLREGDLLIISQVHCRLEASGKPDQNDPAQTMVRMALPKFMLRGVSGPYFSKTFPLRGKTVLGRHVECDIRIDDQGISRRHAELEVTGEGLVVRDLGSSNGTFVNGEKVSEKTLSVGDEVRFDTLRFLVQTPAVPDKPGNESKTAVSSAAEPESGPAVIPARARMLKRITVALVLVAVGLVAAWYLGYLTP